MSKLLHTFLSPLGAVVLLSQCSPPQPTPTAKATPPEKDEWHVLEDGIEYAQFSAPGSAQAKLTVVRIDAKKHPLQMLTCAEAGHEPLPADEWAQRHQLRLVINAGMFETDHSTHVGYLKNEAYVCPEAVRSDYESFVVFGATGAGGYPYHIYDLDVTPRETILNSPQRVILQNLRLIKHPGENRWKPQPRQWSEIALAEDAAGRALIIVCPSPSTMHDFNEHLLRLPIGLKAAQHLEGGPEVSLYLKIGDKEIRSIGSYETGFNENHDNARFWPLPNVLGVR
jgi:hypothetical protein